MAVSSEPISNAIESFRKTFNRSPKWIAAAPGRVNLIGDHVDYNEGLVLPMAVERHVVIAADFSMGNSNGNTANVFSADLNDTKVLDLDPQPSELTHWGSYVEGVLAGFRQLEKSVPSFDALIQSNLPLGSGLSSSAALEVATATMFEAMLGIELEAKEKALLCQQAEHQFVGVPCGIMDQFCSVLGQPDKLMLLDCRSAEVQQIPFADPEVSVLITNSNVRHSLSASEYAIRRAQCEVAAANLALDSLRDCSWEHLQQHQVDLQPVLFRRARHVVGEIERTIAAAKASEEANWNELGRLMYASHDSLRDDFEVSCSELDTLVDIASRLDGVIGSRMTGGGFGGCTVSLVKTNSLDSVMRELAFTYQDATGIEPCLFTTRPVRGAQIISANATIENS